MKVVIAIEKVYIKAVKKGSIAEEIGLVKGDYILSLNQEKIVDILDYKYHMADEYVEVEILHQNGEIEIYEIEKEESEDLGVEFESELIDHPRRCYNKCIFCFMEQLPKNVRDTLIFKDDDYRLSFFSGNYITMTNMKEEDVNRIIRYRISPINISIHATDIKTRCMMLNNRHAGKVLDYLEKFYQAGITMNTQIVLCKNINDGAVLEKTIQDLAVYAPILHSICIVPVGLSKNREGLYPLESLLTEDCKKTIELLQPYQEMYKKKFKTPLVFLADEFYLKAGVPFPPYQDYMEFGQLEDGIGLCALFDHDFEIELKKKSKKVKKESLKKKTVTLITGNIVKEYIEQKVQQVLAYNENIEAQVVTVDNQFFGDEITVTGLVTGRDIIKTLQEKKNNSFRIGDYLIIPNVMLKEDEDIFLDDTTLKELQEALDVKVVVTDGSATCFIQALDMEIPTKKITKLGTTTLKNSYENSIHGKRK